MIRTSIIKDGIVTAKRNRRLLLSILLSLAGLILLVSLAINPLLKKLLANRVENRLVGNFYYNYENLTVDLWTRSVSIENVTWRFPKDTTVFNQKGSIGQLKISGVSLFPLLIGNHFRIQEIQFDSLIVVSRVEKQTRVDSLAKIKSKNYSFNFYDLIKGQMKSLKVGKIAINNGKATWINPETKRIWRKIEEVQFDIRQIELDSVTAAANNGWFILTTATLEGKNGELFLADSLHKIHLRKFQIDYCKKTMTVDSLEVIPIMTKSQMTATKRYETNRLTVVAPRITVTGMDIGALMVSDKLRIEHILIDRMKLNVFRDKNPPIPSDLRIEMPQVELKKLALNIKIDSVQLTNSYINYEELSKETQKAGVVFFSEVNAEIHNITNDSVSYRHNAQARAHLSAMLMGKGRLEADVTFDLLSEKGDHRIRGSIGPFELTELNTLFAPLRAFSLRSGHMNKSRFDIMLNDDIATGNITFLYADLKIDILSKVNLNSKELDNVITSLLANTFLIHSSNPSGAGDPRIGIVHYQRPKNKAMYYYWLQSVLDGMKSTVLTTKEK